MPYIKDRGIFDVKINELVKLLTEPEFKPGNLNYVISSLIWKIFSAKPSYTLANNLIGAIECVKLEFYRRKVSPYEDEKIKENGDIE